MNKLLACALVFSMLGIAGLYFYTSSKTSEPIEITSLTADMIGKSVRIDGFVSSKFISPNNNSFITIDDGTKKIVVIFFKPIDIEQFDEVSILGQVSEKDGKLSILGREIKKK